MACAQVELASVPFLTFVGNKKATGEAAAYSFVLRGYVRHWQPEQPQVQAAGWATSA